MGRRGLIGIAVTAVIAVAGAGMLSASPVAAAAVPVARYVHQIPGSGYGPGDKVVALSFDDGPWYPSTDQILSILSDKHAPATFFQIGRQANAAPDVTRRIAALGHGIGNHTWNHVDISTLPPSGYPAEVDRTSSLLSSLAGHDVRCTRPPGGRYSATTLEELGWRGQTLVMWSADTLDWTRPGPAAIANRALAGLTNGSIILMHDGGGDRSQTVAALPAIIDGIRARGFHLVPICAGGRAAGPVMHDVTGYGTAAGIAAGEAVRSNLAIVGSAATPAGGGYWLVASDGGIFSFGNAPFYGSPAGQVAGAWFVSIEPTPDSHGYWVVGQHPG